MNPYWVMMGVIVVLTPIICWFFTRNQRDTCVPMNRIFTEIGDKRYYIHVAGYLVIIFWKRITDNLNEPIKVSTGHYTDWVLNIEGEFVLWVQSTFSNAVLTEFLNFHYLFIYLFLIYVTTVYYMYSGEKDLTDKVTLNYLLIYALAVPYYLFFNVEVTSSYIPGMEALLYQDSTYTQFYATHDPLDNCVPSLHIAIPFGILAIHWLHLREKGIKMADWKHKRYHQFILLNTVLFAFTILYLGIHWLVDIPLGMLIGGIGALFIHHFQPKLRNMYGRTFKGMTRVKFGRHAFFEGIVVLLMIGALMGSLTYQAETMDERPSMRLGPGDSVHDIIEPIGHGETATFILTNMDDTYPVEVVITELEDSLVAMGDGRIDWSVIENRSVSVAPGETHAFTIDEHKYWHLAIIHLNDSAEGVAEVHIKVEYSMGDPTTSAVLLSLPSMWMTGWVIHRLVRLKSDGRSWLDSTPSHAWRRPAEEE
jgi:hypothetical protein